MSEKKVSLKKAVAAGVCGAVLCSTVTGIVASGVLTKSKAERELEYINESMIEAQTLVDKYFVGEYDREDLRDYVLTGYAVGLNDRWSSYMPPEQYAKSLESKKDTRIGIGVSVIGLFEDEKDPEKCTAIEVQKIERGSPADKAGIGTYDKIVAIDGKALRDYKDYNTAVDTVRGDEGKSVRLTIEDYESGETRDLDIIRREFEQIYVNSHMIDDDTAYVQITQFASKTDEQFIEIMDDLKSDGIENVVFDMRNNPGGALSSLVKTLDYLLPEGNIITLKDKNGDLIEEYTSDDKYCDMNMSVMINADTYSAAEFFAQALREYDMAKIVGEKTVGKGYAQIIYPMSNGGALNLSSECYYTPNGDSLIGVGVEPDISVSLTAKQLKRFYTLSDSDDSQIQAALETLKKG